MVEGGLLAGETAPDASLSSSPVCLPHPLAFLPPQPHTTCPGCAYEPTSKPPFLAWLAPPVPYLPRQDRPLDLLYRGWDGNEFQRLPCPSGLSKDAGRGIVVAEVVATMRRVVALAGRGRVGRGGLILFEGGGAGAEAGRARSLAGGEGAGCLLMGLGALGCERRWRVGAVAWCA